MEKFKLTSEGVAKLQAEYRHLLDVVRPEVTKELVEARALGDLSENADYDAARDRQGKVEARIREIQNILDNHELIKETSSRKVVAVGSTVLIKDLSFNTEEQYEIVGSVEADPLKNRISNESPLAKAIIGQKVGAVVEVNAPVPYNVEIVAIIKK